MAAINEDAEDMFKILIATDNHVGYMEKDPVRCNDSLESFEEILKVAKDQEVDFILLGGDLFHDNKPSRQVLHRMLELLRHYCMGSRPCPIEFRSDPAINFQHSKFPVVNYEDPNYNVSMPIFIIHGNHDDPTGQGNLSAMDLLSVSNLVNYFGKPEDIENIEVSPLLLQKGSARLALFGLGSCRDERLHRLFRKGKVKFQRPKEEEGEWFNMLVLHQNRAKHGETNYIPASFIPGFFDLVMWGHEHECLIDPEFVATGDVDEEGEDRGVFVSQPGSSVATSLSDGEQKPKHIGIMHIKSDCTFKIDPIRLQTIRPFIIESTRLQGSGIHVSDEEGVYAFLTNKVKALIEKVKEENPSTDKIPLVRLKVDYSGGYSSFSLARFGQQFHGVVANPQSILNWFRQRQATGKSSNKKATEQDFCYDLERIENAELHVAKLINEELKKESLDIISEKTLADALEQFVDKEENDALSDCAKFCLAESQTHLKTIPVSSKDISEIIHEKRDELHKVQETKGMEAMRHSQSLKKDSFADESRTFSDDDDSDTPRPKPTRGRGGRGRGTKTSTTSTRGRGAKRGRGSKTAPPSSPALAFRSEGAPTTTRSRGKRGALSYLDDDDDTEDSLVSKQPAAKKPRSTSSFGRSSTAKRGRSVKKDSPIDLTQSGEDSEDDNPFGSIGKKKSRKYN